MRADESKYGVIRPSFWLCDICNKPLGRTQIRLDHSHRTGKFRGWLCNPCNGKLGWFEHRIDAITDLILLGLDKEYKQVTAFIVDGQ